MKPIVPVLLVLLAGCGPSGQSSYQSNEQKAAAAIKTLTVANVDFRSNDRDNNGINDFWTGDIASLYDLKPRGSEEPIRLITAELAAADHSRPGAKPYHGYWFVAMDMDENGAPYRQASGGKDSGQAKYNTSKFGFCAYPTEPGVTGKAVFIVNEGNTIFKKTNKPGPILKFPSDDREDDIPPASPLPLLRITDPDTELRRSLIAAVLETAHVDGTNLLWCVTLQVAWDEMADDIGAKAPTLIGGPAYVTDFNANRGGKNLLKDDWYVAGAGSIKHGILQKIAQTMAARFPGVEVPPDLQKVESPLADRVAFAYLRRILPFKTHYERYPEDFKFGGRGVSAFGVRPHGPRLAAINQVLVHSYTSPRDFTVELATTSEDDRMIVVRLTRKKTLRETVQAALTRLTPTAKSMESHDEFRMPCFNLDIRKRFKELENKRFGPGSGIGDMLLVVLQGNQFSLDEKGVKLISYAKLEYSVINGDYTPKPLPPSKKLICDGPFLFILLKKDAALPYFVLWVANPELLCPR